MDGIVLVHHYSHHTGCFDFMWNEKSYAVTRIHASRARGVAERGIPEGSDSNAPARL